MILYAEDEPENSMKGHCEKLQSQWNNVWLLTLDRQKKLQEAKSSAQREQVSKRKCLNPVTICGHIELFLVGWVINYVKRLKVVSGLTRMYLAPNFQLFLLKAVNYLAPKTR